GARFYEAEVYRLTGMLLLQQSSDHQGEAEAYFHHAMVIAQNQQAKLLQLRAATSLARLWHSQGKRDEARQALGDVYGWFTEDVEAREWQEAKTLLDALA